MDIAAFVNRGVYCSRSHPEKYCSPSSCDGTSRSLRQFEVNLQFSGKRRQQHRLNVNTIIMSAEKEKDKSKVHKLSLKGSAKYVAEFVSSPSIERLRKC
jgi:hypothetical protein